MNNEEGWIEWSVGECPVEPDTPVEYILRSGLRNVCTAGSLDWHHLDDRTDIVRYRVLVPQAQRDELRRAIEAMRIAGGAVEFQAAFDKAKELIKS